MIKQRIMGRTGLKLSEIGLGTCNFGGKADDDTSFGLLDTYRMAGGNFIQSAGDASGLSLSCAATAASEEVVGRWMQSRAIPRQQMLLATRINVSRSADNNISFAKRVFEKCQESLRRFGTTYIDIVIFDWNEGLSPTREPLEAFDGLVRNGIVRFIGADSFPVWRVADTLGRARVRNQCRMETLQAEYSLMTRVRFEPEAMSLCGAQKLGFFARSPLAGGFLAGFSSEQGSSNPNRRAWGQSRFRNAYGDAALTAVADVASRHAASSAQVALLWVLRNPLVTSAIIEVGSTVQLEELIDIDRFRLNDDDLARLNDATALEEVHIPPEFTHHPAEPLELIKT